MMIAWATAVIGMFIVVFSLIKIFQEIKKASMNNFKDPEFEHTYNRLLEKVDQLADNLDDINQSFYDVYEKLEKRISVLENQKKDRATVKEISLEERVDKHSAIEIISEVSEQTPYEEPKDEETLLAEEIKRLLKEGKDTQQIARELRKGVGEVELIKRLKT